jgi:hypothetical protein
MIRKLPKIQMLQKALKSFTEFSLGEQMILFGQQLFQVNFLLQNKRFQC